ncbi:unnamed protein product, partial [Ixodes hexagonus]
QVRPCEWYLEEYKDCKSIRGRFHQYFIFGSTLDCDNWSKDYTNCLRWRKEKDIEALRSVVDSEAQRKKERLDGSLQNNVWELRSEPPKDWNKPLPEWMNEKLRNTYLESVAKEPSSDATSALTKRSCCIL